MSKPFLADGSLPHTSNETWQAAQQMKSKRLCSATDSWHKKLSSLSLTEKNNNNKKTQQGKSNTCQCALSLSLKIVRLHLPLPKPLFVASWLWAGTVGGFKRGQRLPDACLCLHQADNAANRLVYIYSAHFDKASFLPYKRSCKYRISVLLIILLKFLSKRSI